MKIECKYNFHTCSNLLKNFHCIELCDNCDEGQNYQHKDNFKTIANSQAAKNKDHENRIK